MTLFHEGSKRNAEVNKLIHIRAKTQLGWGFKKAFATSESRKRTIIAQDLSEVNQNEK